MVGHAGLKLLALGFLAAAVIAPSCAVPSTTSIPPASPATPPPTKTSAPAPSFTLEQLKASYPELSQELLRLPELKKVMGEKDIEAVEDIVRLALDSQYKTAFESIINEGIKEKRKYCTPLQALLWIAYDTEPYEPARNPLRGYSLERLLRTAWEGTTTSDNYNSPRWQDFDEVIDRLNSPISVAKYMDDQLIYDAPKVVHRPNRTTYAKQTFIEKVGACHDMGNFGAYCLSRNGYEAYILRGGQWKPTKKELQGEPNISRSHSVTMYKEGSSYYVIQGPWPETRPKQQTVKIEGPFDTAEDAARQECCAKMNYIYEWHHLFEPDDPSFTKDFYGKW